MTCFMVTPLVATIVAEMFITLHVKYIIATQLSDVRGTDQIPALYALRVCQ